MKNIKKFHSQRCLGYSWDFKVSYFENIVEYNDGTVETVYSTHMENELENGMYLPKYSTEYPFVAVKLEN